MRSRRGFLWLVSVSDVCLSYSPSACASFRAIGGTRVSELDSAVSVCILTRAETL